VRFYSFNGQWGSFPQAYSGDLQIDIIPHHFDYSEITRVYDDASDGMVPKLSACPFDSYHTGLLLQNNGVAHDQRGNADGPNTETHITWSNYKFHPTYEAICDILFGNGNGGGGTVLHPVGCVLLPTITRNPSAVYTAWQNGNKKGDLWWQDDDGSLTIRDDQDQERVRFTDVGSYMLMAPAGEYDIIKSVRKRIYKYNPNNAAYDLSEVNILVPERSCTVTGGMLTTEQ
jgi:hypothetical protein